MICRDGKSQKIVDENKGKSIFHFIADRQKRDEYQETIRKIKEQFLPEKDEKFDMVVDFCAYTKNQIKVLDIVTYHNFRLQ